MTPLTPLLLAVALGFPFPVQQDAEERYSLLAGLCEKGFYEMAVDEGKAFLRLHPRHEKADLARYRLATALFETDERAAAHEHLRLLAERRGFEFAAEVSFRRGQCALDAEELGEAAASFSRVLELDREYLHLPATFLLAETRFRLEEFETAETAYLEVIRRGGADGEYARDAEYGLSWCAFRRGQHDQAVRRIESFLRRRGEDPVADELRFLLGESHFEADRYDDAYDAYQLVKTGAFHEASLRGAGFAAAELGRHEDAAQRFGDLFTSYPQSRFGQEAALQRGIHLLQSGDSARALSALSARGVGNSAEVFYWRGRAAVDTGDEEVALRSFERALAASPDADLTSRIASARGDLLFELGRLEEATQAYEGAGSDYSLHAAAVASLNEGRHDEAERLSDKLLDDFPDSPYRNHALLTLGESRLAREDAAAAEASFRTIVDGGGAELRARALSRLAWCRYLQDDAGGAAAYFAEIARRHASSPEAEEALFMQGRALADTGEARQAASSWRRYLENYPEGEWRAETLLRLSRLEEGTAGNARLDALLEEFGDGPLAEQAVFELAERRYASGDRAGAREAYAHLIQKFPNGTYAAPARYGLGWVLYEDEEWQQAASQLGRLAADERADAELRTSAQELLVWCEAGAQRGERAAEAWRGLAALGHDQARLYETGRAAAQCLRDGNQLEEALRFYAELRAAIRDEGSKQAISVEQVYLALDLDDAARAQQALLAAAQIGSAPVVMEAAFFLAEARFEAADDAKAIELYTYAASAESPVRDRALYKRGFAYLRGDRFADAAASFQAVAADHPRSELAGECLFLVGEAHFRGANFAAAVAPLESLRSRFPAHEVMPKALFRLGLSYCETEQWAEAETTLADLARRHPDFTNRIEAELWRGRALAHTNKSRAARQAFERVIANDRGSLAAQARLELGRMHLAQSDLESALSEFVKVSVLFSGGEEVAEALYLAGQCLEALNDRDRAIERYRELLDEHATSRFAALARQRLSELGTP